MSCHCLSDCHQLLAPASLPDSCGVAVHGLSPGSPAQPVCRARAKKSIVLVVQNSGTVFLVARHTSSRRGFFVIILAHLRLTLTVRELHREKGALTSLRRIKRQVKGARRHHTYQTCVCRSAGRTSRYCTIASASLLCSETHA